MEGGRCERGLFIFMWNGADNALTGEKALTGTLEQCFWLTGLVEAMSLISTCRPRPPLPTLALASILLPSPTVRCWSLATAGLSRRCCWDGARICARALHATSCRHGTWRLMWRRCCRRSAASSCCRCGGKHGSTAGSWGTIGRGHLRRWLLGGWLVADVSHNNCMLTC